MDRYSDDLHTLPCVEIICNGHTRRCGGGETLFPYSTCDDDVLAWGLVKFDFRLSAAIGHYCTHLHLRAAELERRYDRYLTLVSRIMYCISYVVGVC